MNTVENIGTIKNLKVKTINSWDKLADFWNKNGGRVRRNVISAITATFLAASTSCTSPESKLNQNKSELPVLIENFKKTRADAIATEQLYQEAIKNGDKISASKYKKQMKELQGATIKKIKRIEEIKEKNMKLTLDIRKKEEKTARNSGTINWEDVLNYRP